MFGGGIFPPVKISPPPLKYFEASATIIAVILIDRDHRMMMLRQDDECFEREAFSNSGPPHKEPVFRCHQRRALLSF